MKTRVTLKRTDFDTTEKYCEFLENLGLDSKSTKEGSEDIMLNACRMKIIPTAMRTAAWLCGSSHVAVLYVLSARFLLLVDLLS